MIPEIALLIGVTGGLIVSYNSIDQWFQNRRQKAMRSEKMQAQMQADLRTALQSRDHRKLDDWLVIYADYVTPETRKHVMQRRDELYVEMR